MQKSLLTFSAAVLMVCLMGACSKRTTPSYFIYIVNMTHHDFEGVGIYFNGQMAAEKGHLVEGGLASFGYVTLPIPGEAEVRWIDGQQSNRAPKVKLEGVVPDIPVKKSIYFIIHEDGTVAVKCIDHQNANAAAQATQGLRELRQEIKRSAEAGH